MSEFNDRLVDLTADEQQMRYRQLAAAALDYYDVDDANPVFIQHNAGVAYRVDTKEFSRRYVLKIAETVGDAQDVKPERIRGSMLWLLALARETDLVVQEPIPNRSGEFVTTVHFPDLREPFYCTLQRWVDGERFRGHFNFNEAHRIGVILAQLHQHASSWVSAETLDALELNQEWLSDCLRVLSSFAEPNILSSTEWSTVVAACSRVDDIMARLGNDRQTWGPIHGDLHHGNLIVHCGTLQPIDFGVLRRGYFTYDVGTTLYHMMYQDAEVRRALRDGYEHIYPRESLSDLSVEAMICAAALANLSFQITVPSQRNSPLTARNMREFANVFCANLIKGTRFAFR